MQQSTSLNGNQPTKQPRLFWQMPIDPPGSLATSRQNPSQDRRSLATSRQNLSVEVGQGSLATSRQNQPLGRGRRSLATSRQNLSRSWPSDVHWPLRARTSLGWAGVREIDRGGCWRVDGCSLSVPPFMYGDLNSQPTSSLHSHHIFQVSGEAVAIFETCCKLM